MSTPEKKPSPRPRPSLGWLLELAKPERRAIFLAILMLLVGNGTTLAVPWGLGRMIDAKSKAELNQVALLMSAVLLVSGVAIGLRYVLFTMVGERTVARLRQRLYRTILSQEVAFFDERRTGELMNRLSSDTTMLQSAVSSQISMVLRQVISAVGGIIMLLFVSPLLTVLMLAIVPAVALGAVYYGRKVRAMASEVQDALARASEVTEESISGLRTVRSFAAEEREVARYAKSVDDAYKLALRRGTLGATFMATTSTAGFGAAIAVLWYGSGLVLDQALTTGQLTTFLVYTVQVAFSLGGLSEIWSEFMKATGAAERVFDLLQRTPAMPLHGGFVPDKVVGQVEFDTVRFAYPTRRDLPVLKGMSLTLEHGEVVAMVGSSGAGKSTIAALLTRLYDPDDGRILLDGRDLRELDPSWLRQRIGIVSQEPILFSSSIADNIRYGRPEATDAEVEAAARTANAHDFISRFPDGYRTLVGERGVQLSGGQKQRVAIARALLKDPRILILDEATSALDAESEHLVKEALDRLMKGRTTLVIAHRLSTVVDANRVLVLDGGQVVQSGNHHALMGEEGLYRRLVERQLAAA